MRREFPFPHVRGRDCATATWRNLLAFHGYQLSEAMVFGLGLGLSFWFCQLPEAPFPVMLGQNLALEEDLCACLGIGFRVHEASSPAQVEVAFERTRGGEPIILKADPYHLSYCWEGVPEAERQHFGEHVLLLVGIEGGTAWVSDLWCEELVPVPLEELRRARTAADGPPFLLPRGRWFEVRMPGSRLKWEACIRPAVRVSVERMLLAQGAFGLAGLASAGRNLEQWLSSASLDARALSEALGVIVQRIEEGATGSCFRALFAEFLTEGGTCLEDRQLVVMGEGFTAEVVLRWQTIVSALKELAKDPLARVPARAQEVRRRLEEVATWEQRLCRELMNALG